MTHTIAAPATPGQLREAAGPLAAVLRGLDDDLLTSPAVAPAALILGAEILTARCESCSCATAPGDLCPACDEASSQAVGFRLLASGLPRADAL
jgi:hypothetical protein